MLRAFAIGFGLVGCACGSPAPAPAPASAAQTTGAEATAPQPAASPPPLPAAREATFTQPVHIPLALLAASINAQLPEHETQPRSLLTRPNASPAIEASFEVWRDEVRVQFDGQTVHAEVPLRYAAKFDARLKNPFGGKWLKVAQDADWGTPNDPQQMLLRLHIHVEITPQWELHVHTDVDAPEHGEAPAGELCTGGMFKLCITNGSLAPEVRRRLDAEIVPRIRAELEQLDRKIEQVVQLRPRAERVWRELASPRALGGDDRYSVLMPEQAGLELRAEGDEIVVEPAVYGKVTYHQGQPAPVSAPPLPDKRPVSELPGERAQDSGVFAIDAALTAAPL
jgi:hypothetical protein